MENINRPLTTKENEKIKKSPHKENPGPNSFTGHFHQIMKAAFSDSSTVLKSKGHFLTHPIEASQCPDTSQANILDRHTKIYHHNTWH